MIFFNSRFKKSFKKLPQHYKNKFYDRLDQFLEDENYPTLRKHPLNGEYANYWSISISGDLRAIYKKDGNNFVFVDIGSHSELYE